MPFAINLSSKHGADYNQLIRPCYGAHLLFHLMQQLSILSHIGKCNRMSDMYASQVGCQRWTVDHKLFWRCLRSR
jgi:hypothetical protein